MASIGSLPVVVETNAETSKLLHSNNIRPPRFLLFSHQPMKYSEAFRIKNSAVEHLQSTKLGFSRLVNGCSSKGLIWRTKHLRAVGKSFGESDDNDRPEDVLEATIEKSKKALAIQRDLLQQIAEKRKLVSKINGDSILELEGNGSISYEHTVNSLSNDSNPEETFIGRDNAVEKQNRSAVFSNYAHSSEENTWEASISSVNKGFDEGDKEDEKISPPEKAPSWMYVKEKDKMDDSTEEILEAPSAGVNGDFDKVEQKVGKISPHEKAPLWLYSNGQLKDKRSESIAMHTLPSYIANITETSSLKVETQEGLHESTLEQPDKEIDNVEGDGEKPPPLAGPNVMNVILLAAECAPWSKTGGLGDVAGSLPKALARRGHRVMVVAPRYGNYAEAQDTGVRKMYKVAGQDMEVTYFQAYIDGVDFVFIASPIFQHVGQDIYGGNRLDILRRMVLFCKAAVEVPWYVPCGGVCYGDGNLVFIANDWHTALLPVYLKAYYRDHGLMKFTRSVLVIHNIAHQGRGPVDDFLYVDLPEHYIDLFKLDDPVGGDHLNIFAAGIKTADRVVTVSHGYAWELKTSEGGWGLHGIINDNNWKFRGIVNGIDTRDWNPWFDVHLTSDGYANYSLETFETGKRQCKAALQKELGLPVREDVPVIGFIGRLDHQKGVDLIAEAIPWMMGQDVQLIMLGSGRQDLEQMLRQFDNQHRDKIRGWVGFSVKMAHRITAGADILLMPSRFEPCGLNQLYAMSYGTVPVVHSVGGLRDTVQPFNPFTESGLGWTFDSAEVNKLINALGNCLLTYRQYKKSWEGLQRRGMAQDLSWDNAAQQYEEVLVAAKYQW